MGFTHLMLPAYVPDQIPHSYRTFSLQRQSPVLRNPYQMQVDLEYGVRASPVFRHPTVEPALQRHDLSGPSGNI